LVFINGDLILELKNNIESVLKSSDTNADILIEAILEATIFFETQSLFTNSPDPKDNFLFDLAIQTNSTVIVTKEKALLNFKESPIPIQDIKWFKETYPVEL
jgi:predicted nucleic acid-binding protein